MIDPACPPPFLTHCRCCGQAFNEFNTFSDAGWLETQITGFCEVCFDILSELPRKDDDPLQAEGSD